MRQLKTLQFHHSSRGDRFGRNIPTFFKLFSHHISKHLICCYISNHFLFLLIMNIYSCTIMTLLLKSVCSRPTVFLRASLLLKGIFRNSYVFYKVHNNLCLTHVLTITLKNSNNSYIMYCWSFKISH